MFGLKNKKLFPMLTDFELAQLIAAAPSEIPNWFVDPAFKEKQPSVISWMYIKNPEDREEVRQWVSDGCFELSDHLEWFAEKYRKDQEGKAEFFKRKEVSRYFQWRLYYANTLLNYLLQSIKPKK